MLEPACLSVDFPRYLAFVPAAPTEVSILADLVVSACSIYGGSWQEGAGAVWAENQALRWLADLAGLPASAGGCFVPGGTVGNLSALVAARTAARAVRPGVWDPATVRGVVVTGTLAHSSIRSACEVMDLGLVTVPGPRLTGAGLSETLESTPGLAERAVAVVATAGSTNLGLVDDMASVADVCAPLGLWLHVDGAYGSAALVAPSARHRFDGIERADSFIVDPHKWLFAPYDACALVYREPSVARRTHSQQAAYLDVLNDDAQWNPSDYAIHLTRRARGGPLLVLPGRPRHGGVRGGRRAVPGRGPPGRGAGGGVTAAVSGVRARAVGAGLPAPRLGGGRVRRLVGRAAADGGVLRGALGPRRRADAAVLRGQPPHHGGRPAVDPGHALLAGYRRPLVPGWGEYLHSCRHSKEGFMERVVLGRREGGVAGFHWSGNEPEDLNSVALAEEMGAVWEGRELVHYDMASLVWQMEHMGDDYMIDND